MERSESAAARARDAQIAAESKLREKFDLLDARPQWCNSVKRALLDEHAATWRTNGLSSLGDPAASQGSQGVVLLARRSLAPHATLLHYDIGLSNGHWADDTAHT